MSEHDSSVTPLPHHRAAVDQFFAAPEVRGFVLHWDTGAGRSYAMALIVKHLTAHQPTARVVVLVPTRAVQVQILHVMAGVGLDAEGVDRFRYREMQDARSPDLAIWSRGRIFVLTTDFAMQDDVALSLSSVPWSLLVVEKGHELRGKRETRLRSLVQSIPSARVLLLSNSVGNTLPSLGIERWRESRVRLADLVDASGRRLYGQTPPSLRAIEYRLDESERHLRAVVASVVASLRTSDRATRLIGATLSRTNASSPLALEKTVRRVRNRLALGEPEFGPVEVEDEDELAGAEALPPTPPVSRSSLIGELDACLAALDSLSTDSKLSAFTVFLQRELKAVQVGSILVLSQYRATVVYLQAALEELGLSPLTLHAAMPPEDRVRAIREFRQAGGVLVGTMALTSTGYEALPVELVILYDEPRSRTLMQQILSQFARYETTKPLLLGVMREVG